ncbi:MAG: response regulator [Planctomycetales bacterium]|nr:response regulator [Planctomycetales bacterium]
MFPTILVVDDTPVDRRLVGGLLAEDQFLDVRFAENGREALAMIEEETPRLVLTDLVMPEMDGLEFVRQVQQTRPSLPIVLMTAYGSGETALEALRCGATSYIPKSQMSDRLLRTVQRLLGMTGELYNLQLITEHQTRICFEYSVPCKLALIDALLGVVHKSAAMLQLGNSGERLQMSVALEQALLNAIYRGNLEISYDEMTAVRGQGPRAVTDLIKQRNSMPRYSGRKVFLKVDMNRERAEFTVRDDGNGFDTSLVPARDDPDQLDATKKQGLVLMTNLMDEVHFNTVGNEVVLVKRAASDSVSPGHYRILAED